MSSLTKINAVALLKDLREILTKTLCIRKLVLFELKNLEHLKLTTHY